MNVARAFSAQSTRSSSNPEQCWPGGLSRVNFGPRISHNPAFGFPWCIKLMRIVFTGSLLLLSLLASCATPKPPPDAFAVAEKSIDAAVRAGAEQHAPVELRFAREKLLEAQKGVEYKQYDKSFYLIEQSEINAELAIEKSRGAQVRAEVTALTRENEVLRQDFEATFGESPQ